MCWPMRGERDETDTFGAGVVALCQRRASTMDDDRWRCVLGVDGWLVLPCCDDIDRDGDARRLKLLKHHHVRARVGGACVGVYCDAAGLLRGCRCWYELC